MSTTKRFARYWHIFWQLFQTDLLVFWPQLWDDTLNKTIWLSSLLVLSAYVFPLLGIMKSFGVFTAFALIASESYWRMWPSTFEFIADLDGERSIDYLLTLPIPSWLIFVQTIVLYIFKSIIFGFITFILTILIIWNEIDWHLFSWPKTLTIFMAISLFTSCFFLLLASIAKNRKNLHKIGFRIIFPLWFFGATQFPWQVIYDKVSPKLAYILLANPWVYAMEGMHAATMGQQGFLPFWVCLGVLLTASFLFGTVGIARLIKRLDAI